MPSLDPVRHRISITDEDLEVLRRHSVGDDAPDLRARLDVLAEAGLVTTAEAVHPLVSDLARCMSQPLLELWVEASGTRGVTMSHVVVAGDETLWYTDPWPGTEDGELVYVQDEMPMLPWVLAGQVGFRRATPPEGVEPLSMPLVTMATMLAALSGGDGVEWEDARNVFIARSEELLSDLPRRQQDIAVAVLATLESPGASPCAWGPEVEHARGIAAWYCGDGGYWVRTDPPEPLLPEQVTAEVIATFTPMTGGQVWEQLIDLIPSKSELMAGIAAAEELAGAPS